MKKPYALKRGDKVAIVSLSSGILGEKMFIHKYEIAKSRLENDYGFKVVAMPNALKGVDYIYHHPEKRAEDLMNAFKDKEIKAIFSAIGGEDSIRLLPYIDLDVIKNNPKIFTGFSDSTVNHMMMFKARVISYYGLSVMNNIGEYVSINEYTSAFIDNMLINPKKNLDIPCSKFTSYDENKVWWGEDNINKRREVLPNTPYEILQGKGKVSGELLGGCLDVFISIIGTKLWPTLDEWKGKILLLETSEENMSDNTLTWILRNLEAEGILKVIKGIIVGKPAFKDKEESYKKVYLKVINEEAGLKDLPILYNVNVGHAYPIGLFGIGLKYEIDADNKTLTLLEEATIKEPRI